MRYLISGTFTNNIHNVNWLSTSIRGSSRCDFNDYNMTKIEIILNLPVESCSTADKSQVPEGFISTALKDERSTGITCDKSSTFSNHVRFVRGVGCFLESLGDASRWMPQHRQIVRGRMDIISHFGCNFGTDATLALSIRSDYSTFASFPSALTKTKMAYWGECRNRLDVINMYERVEICEWWVIFDTWRITYTYIGGITST